MADTTVLGFITPETEPATDRALEDIFQAAIRGITGLPGAQVRPQAPATINNLPEVTVDWVSFRVTPKEYDFDAHLNHQPTLLVNGGSVVSRDEKLEVQLSFFGPLAQQYVNRWVNGLSLDQNRWTLMDNSIKFHFHGSVVSLPALLKEQWQRRLDITSIFSRRLKTTYPIRTIESADMGLNNERYITPIIVQQP